MFEQWLVAVLATLFVTGLFAWFKHRRLRLYVPRLFSYSALSDQGTIVELLVVNKGYRSEESIQITLKPRLQYQLVAATAKAITLDGSTLTIPRLAAKQEASVVLLAEGSEFSQDDVVSATSKETVAKVLKSHPDVEPTLPALVGTLISMFVIAAVPALITSQLTEEYGRNIFLVALEKYSPETVAQRKSLEADGWTGLDRYFDSKLQMYYKDKRFPIENVIVKPEAGGVHLTADIANLTPEFMEVSFSFAYEKAPGTTSRAVSFWNANIAPGNTKRLELTLSVARPYADPVAGMKVTIEGGGDRIIWFRKQLALKER